MAYRDLILRDRPYLYYEFNDWTTKLVDSSGGGVNGTYTSNYLLGQPGMMSVSRAGCLLPAVVPHFYHDDSDHYHQLDVLFHDRMVDTEHLRVGFRPTLGPDSAGS